MFTRSLLLAAHLVVLVARGQQVVANAPVDYRVR
jgi:hypothetical protein